MTYNVNIDTLSQDINDEVRSAILTRITKYDFPYVSTIPNKVALRDVFKDHFENKRSLAWLEGQLSRLITSKRGITPTARTETNRLHTGGLADVLILKGETKCTTVHSYGMTGMSPKCQNNIDGKTLDIKAILVDSFPKSIADLNKDVPMIPQHVSCRHVMAPLNDKILNN